MQALTHAVAVFCIACLCAELLTLFVPPSSSGWARRCIKAVAGLYILVVFARVLPKAGVELQKFTPPQAQPVFFGTLEDIVESEAARRTEEAEEAGEDAP